MTAKLFYVAMAAACCTMASGKPSAAPFLFAPTPTPSEVVTTASPGYDFGHPHVDTHYHQQPSEHDDFGHDADDRQLPSAGSSYHFAYSVEDPLTGDVKSQNEVSDGRGTVKGTYSMVEADGSTRVVEYTADDEHGFNAEVKRIAPQHRYAAASADSSDLGLSRRGGGGGVSSVEIIRATDQQDTHFYLPEQYVITSVRR